MTIRDFESIQRENIELVEAVLQLETTALQEQRKNKRRERLFKLLQLLHGEISQAQDTQTICRLAVQFLVDKIEFDRAVIFQQVEDVVIPIAHWGYGDRLSCEAVDAPIAEWLKTSQSIIVNGQKLTASRLSWNIQSIIEVFEVPYFLALPMGLPSRNQYLLLVGNQTEETFKHPTLIKSDLEIFQALANQIAISIHQTELYIEVADARARAEEQSKQLQHTLQHLQETQAQVIQSEKMSALGNLVAGVAHEINNPIGFLKGSISHALDYSQSLLNHIDLYEQHCSDPIAAIQDNADNIDLDYLRDDFPHLLDSMMRAIDRITGISASLRTFSRADTDHKVRADLHEGLDSTILIVKYRLKANEYRPAIEIIQNYGDVASIDCFIGQLNQVFMNILANAIDVFDEMAQEKSLTDSATQQKITITTTTAEREGDRYVEIRIADNGKGMPLSVKQQIFEHLFTTKAVGKGTGLGLSIARQIVVEKHGGYLEVNSELGQGTEFCIGLPMLV